MSYKHFPITGPFKGIVDDIPRPNAEPNAFDDVVNFLCRKGRLQSRPKFNASTAPTDGKPVRNMITFADVNGSFHTLVLTDYTAYYLSGGGATYTAINNPAALTDLHGSVVAPFGLAALNNRIYFANGNAKILYCDGSNTLAYAGATVVGSARFLTVNAAHLIAAYCTEPVGAGAVVYPARVRWSKSGDPNDWTDFSAGYADLIEVVEYITGLVTLRRNTFIFRNNGITAMFPTGVGTSPFALEQFSYAPQGVGNVFPYSLAAYGDMAVFVAQDDIYSLNGTTLQAIGTRAKKKIFADLAAASGDQVVGFFVTRFGVAFDFLSYWLSIPGQNVTWIYHFDEQNWVRMTSSAGRLTCVALVATS